MPKIESPPVKSRRQRFPARLIRRPPAVIFLPPRVAVAKREILGINYANGNDALDTIYPALAQSSVAEGSMDVGLLGHARIHFLLN